MDPLPSILKREPADLCACERVPLSPFHSVHFPVLRVQGSSASVCSMVEGVVVRGRGQRLCPCPWCRPPGTAAHLEEGKQGHGVGVGGRRGWEGAAARANVPFKFTGERTLLGHDPVLFRIIVEFPIRL